MKYLTKGELLTILGDDANKFTLFMMDPESFGLAGDVLTAVKIAKQKLDWTNTVDMEMPETITLANLLESYGVISMSTKQQILNVPNRKDADVYIVNILAQDEITVENVYGVVYDGNTWNVRIKFINKSSGEEYEEIEKFDYIPQKNDIDYFIYQKIKELKAS